MDNEEKKHIQGFLESTEKRIIALEAKRPRTRAEDIELNMCRGDVKRAKDALSKKK